MLFRFSLSWLGWQGLTVPQVAGKFLEKGGSKSVNADEDGWKAQGNSYQRTLMLHLCQIVAPTMPLLHAKLVDHLWYNVVYHWNWSSHCCERVFSATGHGCESYSSLEGFLHIFTQWERPKKKQKMAMSYHHGFNCHFLSRFKIHSTSRAPCSTLRLHEHRLLGPMVDVLLRYGYGPKFDTPKIGCLISKMNRAFPYLMIYYVSSGKLKSIENCPFIVDLPIKKCDFP